MLKHKPSQGALEEVESQLKGLKRTLELMQLEKPTREIKELAALQTQVDKVHKELKERKIEHMNKLPPLPQPQTRPEPRREVNEYRRPVKSALAEMRRLKQLGNPQSAAGSEWLRERYNLPEPTKVRVRNVGKTTYSRPKVVRMAQPNILPKQYRDNPLADPPPITEKDIQRGLLDLISKGFIPKDVDLTPAFERGVPAYSVRPADYIGWREAAPLPIEYQSLPPPESKAAIQFSEPTVSGESRSPASELQIVPAPESPEPIRTYEEMVDAFSSHQLMLRKGKVITNTPEFASYRRIYAQHWAEITDALQFAEDVFGKYNIPLVFLNGKKLAELFTDEVRKISEEELFSCVINREQVLPFTTFRLQLSGMNGRHHAATKIQTAYRRYRAASAYLQLKVLKLRAVVIQHAFKAYKNRRSTAELIQIHREELLAEFTQQQSRFMSSWSEIMTNPRIEVHINSQGRPFTGDVMLQELQIARLFRLKDANVNIVYVTTVEIPREMQEYYFRLLEANGFTTCRERVDHGIKGKHQFRAGFQLRLAGKIRRKIRALIGDRPAYIVPGDVDDQDVLLSLEMKLPLFCGDLLQTQFCTLRSGAKRLFELSDIPVPPSRYDIGTPDQFYESLGKLVLAELLVNTWVLKIDTEKSGKGMATVTLSEMKYVTHLRNNYDSISADNIHVLIEELRKEVPVRVKLPSGYDTWENYLAQFCAKHGVIEATPLVDASKITPFCVTFTIQPNGEIADLSAFDRYQVNTYTAEGHLYPQQSLKGLNLELLSTSLAQTLYQRKGVWGFIKIDFIAFPDPLMTGEDLFWALDLSVGLSVFEVTARMFDCLLQGEIDLVRKQYLIASEDESSIVEDFTRCYFMCEQVMHSGLSAKGLSGFLAGCEEANLTFDSGKKVGVVLLPYDDLRSNAIGLMVVGASKGECRRLMSRALTHIDNVLNPKGRGSELQASYDEKSSLLSIVKNLSL